MNVVTYTFKRKIFLYYDVFNFIYKHHDQYTSYTHNFSFAKVLDGTPVNLTNLSKWRFQLLIALLIF